MRAYKGIWRCLRLSTAALILVYLAVVVLPHLAVSAIAVVAVVAPVYLLVHVLRAIRLFLLLYDGELRLREALLVHVHAAGVSALIPFKVGEIYRVIAIFLVTGHMAKALVAVWIERVFDALFVVVILGLVAWWAGPQALAGIAWFFPVVAGFLFVSFFLFLVLPENLILVKRHLILKHNNLPALHVLRWIDALHRLLREAASIWRSRFATIVWLSMGIWLLEVGLMLAVTALWVGGGEIAQGFARIFTHITVSSSPWTNITQENGTLGPLIAYRFATVDVLVLCALGIALCWSPNAKRSAVPDTEKI